MQSKLYGTTGDLWMEDSFDHHHYWSPSVLNLANEKKKKKKKTQSWHQTGDLTSVERGARDRCSGR